jgi:hypothetical protein
VRKNLCKRVVSYECPEPHTGDKLCKFFKQRMPRTPAERYWGTYACAHIQPLNVCDSEEARADVEERG